ncbi:hypothetical protein MAUB1S_10115 [Mycolicibacterium aubagnense]
MARKWMILEDIYRYLGEEAPRVIKEEPFCRWRFNKIVEGDLDELIISYEDKKNGIIFSCNSEELIDAIFVARTGFYGSEKLYNGLSFSSSREMVGKCLGHPSKSGYSDLGAWDRFSFPGYTVHFEYRVEGDGINMVTFMANDVVP